MGKLKNASYATHMIGKWDLGYATEQHLPINRGYDTSMVYLNAANDYFTQASALMCNNTPVIDFWANGQPLFDKNGTNYEEFLFEEHIKGLLDSFANQSDDNDPFFIMYAPHLVHAPQ